MSSKQAADRDRAAPPPLCFVLMPFGVRPDANGSSVDFDAVYSDLLAPAIRAAGLEPLRADQELVGGIVHKPMFERLVLADYAIADLTSANPNVFYELGVRHAVRPYSTVLVSAETKRIPFDLAPDRVLPYSLNDEGRPAAGDEDRTRLAGALQAARRAQVEADSPVFQLIDKFPSPDIDRLKTDVFRDQAVYSAEVREQMATARSDGADAVRAVQAKLGPPKEVEVGVLIDLLLSFRATEAWDEMIALVEAMPDEVRRTVLVREQYGFALNRAGQREKAERVLLAVLEQHGDSSETLGLLGRVYKDRWEAELEGSKLKAAGYLDQAIDAYRRGFEADWRDAYPGVNAVSLMEIRDPGGEPQRSLVPVVRYANQRRIEQHRADYWDYATALELNVVGRDQERATVAAQAALALVREPWEPKSTARNLSLIRRSRAEQGETVAWADEIEASLRAAGED